MVIFVVAIPKTIPYRRLPLKAASAGTPTLRDVSAVGFWGQSNGDGSPKNDSFACVGLYGSGAFAHHTAWVAGGGPAMNARAAGKRAVTRGRRSEERRVG